jgi:phosphoglucosamine mutase
LGKLFRTDGVRGLANRDLTPSLALRLGAAYGTVLGRDVPDRRPRIVLGKDTRISGDMLEAAFVAGACSAGVDVHLCGVIPTPAVALLTRSEGFDGGVMVSASHNPIVDNGIKIFSARGFKIADETEERIEQLVLSDDPLLGPTGTGVGRALRLDDAESRYVRYVVEHTPARLEGLKVVLDCAFGAAWNVASRVFRELGAEVVALHDEADGTRINVACGSTDLAPLAEAVVRVGADLGLGFDGDADRCLAVDEAGQKVNGDQMLLAFARTSGEREKASPVVVATVMSNLGLEMSLRDLGWSLRRAAVGDRFVLEEMLRCGSTLGGEQSGHIIFLAAATTGDGVMTAARLAAAVRASGQPLSALTAMPKVPQMLVNVTTPHKDRLDDDHEIAAAIAEVEGQLAGRGRLLVRPSGTEPMVRVMAEGPDADELEQVVSRLVRLIERRLS